MRAFALRQTAAVQVRFRAACPGAPAWAGSPFFEPAPVRLGIIAPVAQKFLRPPFGPPAAALQQGNRFDQGHQLGDVVSVGFRDEQRQRQPLRIYQHMVLGSQLASIHRTGACFSASAGGSYSRTIHRCSRPVDLALLLQLFQEAFQELVPNASSLPAQQPSPAGVTTGKLAGSRQRPPRHSGFKHKENTRNDSAVRRRLAACIADMSINQPSGQQRLQALPQFIGHQRFCHNVLSGLNFQPRAGSINTLQAQNSFNFVTRSKESLCFLGSFLHFLHSYGPLFWRTYKATDYAVTCTASVVLFSFLTTNNARESHDYAPACPSAKEGQRSPEPQGKEDPDSTESLFFDNGQFRKT